MIGIIPRGASDFIGETAARIHAVVHRMKIHIREHRAAAIRPYAGVIEPFGLPFDQHIADIEYHGLNGHSPLLLG